MPNYEQVVGPTNDLAKEIVNDILRYAMDFTSVDDVAVRSKLTKTNISLVNIQIDSKPPVAEDVTALEIDTKNAISDILVQSQKLRQSGVGDQPSVIEFLAEDAFLAFPPPRIVEKKSRVTDLIKNSPKIISEYLKLDQATRQNQDKWEEEQEEHIQVIDLQEDKEDGQKIIIMTSDADMDLIDLSVPNDNLRNEGAEGDIMKNGAPDCGVGAKVISTHVSEKEVSIQCIDSEDYTEENGCCLCALFRKNRKHAVAQNK